MRSEILLVNTNSNTVQANGTVPAGSVIRRYGQALAPTATGVNAIACGYYDVFVGLTIAPASAGSVTASLVVNGVQYPGATATVTTAAAGDAHSIVIPTCVRVTCNDLVSMSVVLSETATVTSYTLMVDKE